MNRTKNVCREITIIRLYSNIPLTSAEITTTISKEDQLKTYFIHKEYKFQIFSYYLTRFSYSFKSHLDVTQNMNAQTL